MIEIGKKKVVPMRVLLKTNDGKRRFVPKIGADGHPEIVFTANEPVRITRKPLDGTFCRDHGRKLVIRLRDGDVIEMRPQGTRHAVTASLFDAYARILRAQADKANMARLREIKAAKEQRRAEQRLRRHLR